MEDWNTATPDEGSRAEAIAISSDHEPDSDFEEPQPRKKRRVTRNGSDVPKLKPSTSKSKSKLPDKAEADQHTVTQLWRMPNGSTILADEIDDDGDDDDIGFNIYADDGRDRYTSMIAEQQKERRRKIPWLKQDDAAAKEDASRDSPATRSAKKQRTQRLTLPLEQENEPTTLGRACQESPAQTRRYDLRSPAKVAESPVRLSPYQIASRDFHTPKKSRLREIPSSQTPASAKLSVRRSQRLNHQSPDQRSPLKEKQLRSSPLKKVSVQRSPLKERSVNVPFARKKRTSPESQNPTMKMLERVRLIKMGKIPADESQFPSSQGRPDGDADEPTADGHAAAEHPERPNEDFEDNANDHIEESETGDAQGDTAEPVPPLSIPRTLKRTATAQESGTGVMPPPGQAPPRTLKRTTTVQDSQMDEIPLAPAPRELKRTASVQDSQCEDLDMSSDTYRSIPDDSRTQQPAEHDDDDEDYGETAAYDQGPYTYDPVAAALDRDAARFGWTQTQAPLARVVNSVCDPDDEDEEDLDRGIESPSDDEEEVTLLAQQPITGPSQELGEDSDPRAVASQDDAAHEPDHAEPAGIQCEQEALSDSPPSSPPTLRPSQVSTVVPTQMSPRQLTQRVKFEEEEEEYSPPTSPPAPAPAASPTHKATVEASVRPMLHPRTQELQFSSSPLPFPPWSSPDRRRWAALESQSVRETEGGLEKAREALDNLSDFSLPPPPPLMSSAGPRFD